MPSKKIHKERVSWNMVLTGSVLGAVSWIAAASISVLTGAEGTLLEALMPATSAEIVIRSFVMLLVVGMGVYGGIVVSRLKYSEEVLAVSEQRYRNVIETAQDVIYTLGPDGSITSLNPVFEAITGWRCDDMIGKPFKVLVHAEDLPLAEEYMRTLLAGKSLPLYELRILTKQGHYLTGEFKTSPQFREGSVVGILGIVRDITVRRLAEQVLLESESKYRDLFENANDIIQSVAADGSFLYVNRAWREALGYSEEEIAGLTILDIIHPDYKGHCLDIFSRVSTGEQVENIEAVFVTKQGKSLVVEGNINCSIIDGKPAATRGIFRDITEHRQATEFIRNILESVDEGFTVINRDYQIISANKAYSERMKTPLREIIGRHCYEVSHRIAKPCFEAGEDCAVQHTFKTGEPRTAVHIHYDKDNNPVYIETKSFPLRDSLGRVISAIEIHNDITEKKKLEDQLRHSQKMEAVGTLAGGIAHDFNNILTAIIGYGTLLQMRMGNNDALRLYVDQILTSTERAANLTQSLLAFSRKQTISLKPLDLNALVTRVDKLVRRLIGEDVEIRMSVNDALITVRADEGQLEQVVMNLVTNARDAMPGGGVLTIETSTVELDNDYIKAHGYGRAGSYALLAIADTGEGMDERTQARIFEPFFTTKEVGKGTGLGLSIVYGIIKQHGGYINVVSEPGSGTQFKLYLPLITDPVRVITQAEPAIPEVGRATILVAEDDDAVRMLTRAVLEGFGYTVIEAVDGEDALAQYAKHKEQIDLLVLDIVMPKKSGLLVFEEIRKDRSDIKALFTSGYPQEVIRAKGILDDSLNFLSKPVSPRGLLKKVKDVLDGRMAAPMTSA